MIGPKELEKTLGQWTHQDDPDNRWRIALGYLLAEQGKLADAIRTFEAVEADDELSPAAYRTLADWYLADNRRDAHERAVAAVYKTTSEYGLQQMIANKLRPWQYLDGRLPTQLDKDVLRMFAVLFDKSATPQSYLGYLQQFYQASHDFRLLAGLPDAVIGHTAAGVYPFLQGMQLVLDEVRGRGNRRRDRQAHRRSTATRQDRRRSAGARPARSAGGTPRRRGAEPARPAPGQGAGGP